MDDILDDIIAREGGFSNDPTDKGGRTDKGISEKAHPGAWADGKITTEEARAIYAHKYIKAPGFDKIPAGYETLRVQLIDFGVNSGPGMAIQKLQEIIGAKIDGNLGKETISLVPTIAPAKINNLLVAARIRMIGRIVVRDPSQVKYLSGWLNRALEFMV